MGTAAKSATSRRLVRPSFGVLRQNPVGGKRAVTGVSGAIPSSKAVGKKKAKSWIVDNEDSDEHLFD